MNKNRAPDHVALLRGINVGGKNILPMRDLAAVFSDGGCGAVKTLIQSGNVVFYLPSSAQLPALRTAVQEQIAARFGFLPAVIFRSAGELQAAIEGNPFRHENNDPARVFVGFFDTVPGRDRVGRVDPTRSPGDRFSIRGAHIYVHYPDGVAKSKLTSAYIDSALGARGTYRNWRTVTRLSAMMGLQVSP